MRHRYPVQAWLTYLVRQGANVPFTESEHRALYRWRHEDEHVGIAAADRWLTARGLSLTRFEQWLEDHNERSAA